jgi:hypothetical protein
LFFELTTIDKTQLLDQAGDGRSEAAIDATFGAVRAGTRSTSVLKVVGSLMSSGGGIAVKRPGKQNGQYRSARNLPPPTDKPPDPAPNAKPQSSERPKLRILADIASRHKR